MSGSFNFTNCVKQKRWPLAVLFNIALHSAVNKIDKMGQY